MLIFEIHLMRRNRSDDMNQELSFLQNHPTGITHEEHLEHLHKLRLNGAEVNLK